MAKPHADEIRRGEIEKPGEEQVTAPVLVFDRVERGKAGRINSQPFREEDVRLGDPQIND